MTLEKYMTSRLAKTRQKVEHFNEYFSAAGGKSHYYLLHEAAKVTKRLVEATHYKSEWESQEQHVIMIDISL